MQQHIRFGDYVQEVGIRHDRVSYNEVVALSAPARLELRPSDVAAILRPYVSPRFFEQFRAVIPLALYLVAFQLLFLRQPVEGGATIAGAMVAVVVGLMLFMEGLKLGLMPLGERLGETLPTHQPLLVVLLVVFILGIGVTFAEPAIGALKAAGALVSAEEAPALYGLLNAHSGKLVLVVGVGVGAAAVLGTLRFVYSWSLKPLIYATLVPCLALTAYARTDPDFNQIVGLAWDSGAVTTGPVTVPLVLALGIGVAHAVGRGGGSLSGFGIVTLASLFPVLGVLLLGLVLGEPDGAAMSPVTEQPWWSVSPAADVIGAFRAIVPLLVFLVLVLKVLVRKDLRHQWMIAYGIVLTLAGMATFNIGLSYGLAELGTQSGSALPAAFLAIGDMPDSPLYVYAMGLTLVVAFAWILGFGATLAEPALNALGITVEDLTNGAFSRRLLMLAVAIGVACGIALGILKLVYGFDLSTVLLPGYTLLLVLTAASSEEFVNVAWDSAGVTTGPVTVPLVLAMGLGLGDAVRATDGFGVLALASLCPIASVLICGLIIRWRMKREHLV
ncbi:MAG: DUF1538 domain-containing protein [Longimicrobiales bacterium]